MEKPDDHNLSELFADLTCILEDSAGLAVEGQDQSMSVAELRGLAADLSRLGNEARTKLAQIEKELELPQK